MMRKVCVPPLSRTPMGSLRRGYDGARSVRTNQIIEARPGDSGCFHAVLNGLEVAHRISKSMPEVKILLFTMHNSPQFAKDVGKSGAHGYVCKASGEELLTQAMETVLEGESFLIPMSYERDR